MKPLLVQSISYLGIVRSRIYILQEPFLFFYLLYPSIGIITLVVHQITDQPSLPDPCRSIHYFTLQVRLPWFQGTLSFSYGILFVLLYTTVNSVI